MSDKKKVYVETTVISDATALPTRDLVQAGRQLVTREWWDTAAERFDLFSSNVVANEARRGDPDVAKRRIESSLCRKSRIEAIPLPEVLARLAEKVNEYQLFFS